VRRRQPDHRVGAAISASALFVLNSAQSSCPPTASFDLFAIDPRPKRLGTHAELLRDLAHIAMPFTLLGRRLEPPSDPVRFNLLNPIQGG
jgi:hypothetical protein